MRALPSFMMRRLKRDSGVAANSNTYGQSFPIYKASFASSRTFIAISGICLCASGDKIR